MEGPLTPPLRTELCLSKKRCDPSAFAAIAGAIRENRPLFAPRRAGASGPGDAGPSSSNKPYSLSARDCGIDTARCIQLALALGSSTRVTALDLSNNPIGAEGARALGHALGRAPQITSLALASVGMGSSGAISVMKSVPVGSQLHSVDLAKNGLGVDWARSFAEKVKFLPQLGSLCLRDNPLGSAGGRIIASMLEPSGKSDFRSSILSLDIGGCDLGPQGIVAVLQAAAGCPCLRKLSLPHNDMAVPTQEGGGGAGAGRALEQALTHCRVLSALDLSANKCFGIAHVLTPALTALGRDPSAPLASLHVDALDLGSQLAPARGPVWRALSAAKHLKFLSLRSNRLCDDTLRRHEEASTEANIDTKTGAKRTLGSTLSSSQNLPIEEQIRCLAAPTKRRKLNNGGASPASAERKCREGPVLLSGKGTALHKSKTVDSASWDLLRCITASSTLVHLDLSDNLFTGNMCALLKRLTRKGAHQTLRRIDLAGNRISPARAQDPVTRSAGKAGQAVASKTDPGGDGTGGDGTGRDGTGGDGTGGDGTGRDGTGGDGTGGDGTGSSSDIKTTGGIESSDKGSRGGFHSNSYQVPETNFRRDSQPYDSQSYAAVANPNPNPNEERKHSNANEPFSPPEFVSRENISSSLALARKILQSDASTSGSKGDSKGDPAGGPQALSEYIKMKKSFYSDLQRVIARQNGAPLRRYPKIGGKQLDLFHFYLEVVSRGGFDTVTSGTGTGSGGWMAVFKRLANYTTKATDASFRLKRYYHMYLYEYEQMRFFNLSAEKMGAVMVLGREAELETKFAQLNEKMMESSQIDTLGPGTHPPRLDCRCAVCLEWNANRAKSLHRASCCRCGRKACPKCLIVRYWSSKKVINSVKKATGSRNKRQNGQQTTGKKRKSSAKAAAKKKEKNMKKKPKQSPFKDGAASGSASGSAGRTALLTVQLPKSKERNQKGPFPFRSPARGATYLRTSPYAFSSVLRGPAGSGGPKDAVLGNAAMPYTRVPLAQWSTGHARAWVEDMAPEFVKYANEYKIDGRALLNIQQQPHVIKVSFGSKVNVRKILAHIQALPKTGTLEQASTRGATQCGLPVGHTNVPASPTGGVQAAGPAAAAASARSRPYVVRGSANVQRLVRGGPSSSSSVSGSLAPPVASHHVKTPSPSTPEVMTTLFPGLGGLTGDAGNAVGFTPPATMSTKISTGDIHNLAARSPGNPLNESLMGFDESLDDVL